MRFLRSFGGALSVALILGLLALAAPAGAQTLTALTMERVVQLSNVLTTITPAGIPTTVLAALASGSLEIHEQTNYNPQANTLTSTIFTVPAGSSLPTAIGTLPANAVVANFAMSIDKIYITTSAVQFTGSISQSSLTPYGNYQGAPETFSFGYTKDTPPKINNIIETVAGTIVIYSASATGTFTIMQPSTGGGGGGGSTGVTIVIVGPGGTSMSNSFQTTVNQVYLNASGSTSTNAGALTYTWSTPAGSPTAAISFPSGNTAMPFIQLTSGQQTYTINLTVTDATGATATATITIQYI